MKSHLHLILQIQISMRHKRKQLWQIGWQLIPVLATCGIRRLSEAFEHTSFPRSLLADSS